MDFDTVIYYAKPKFITDYGVELFKVIIWIKKGNTITFIKFADFDVFIHAKCFQSSMIHLVYKEETDMSAWIEKADNGVSDSIAECAV